MPLARRTALVIGMTGLVFFALAFLASIANPGFDAEEGDLSVLTPTKKPAGGELIEEQKAFTRMLSAVSAIVAPPLPGGETPVWLREGSLSRSGEEYRTARHAVCTGQSVAGPQAIAAFAR